MHKLNLVLFFTWGISLDIWWRTGMFDREVALYRALHTHGVAVTFVTYGHASDLKYSRHIPEIKIICNRWRLPLPIYKRLLPFLYPVDFKNCDVIKTNQTNGADVALRTSRLWAKPWIARCGYMWSDFVIREQGAHSQAAQKALAMEEMLFGQADRAVVTTPEMADSITQRLPSVAKRLHIIPNYVNTDLFSPQKERQPEYDVIFVGRLSPQKNVLALLEAVQALQIPALFIGDGELHPQIEAAVNSNPLILWHRHVPNTTLPQYLNRARLFVLPSLYEGHPKSLIEAMACGLPVIGAHSPGVENLICHQETGWLCSGSVDGLKTAITHVLNRPDLRDELGENARNYVLQHFALSRIVQMELTLLTNLTQR